MAKKEKMDRVVRRYRQAQECAAGRTYTQADVEALVKTAARGSLGDDPICLCKLRHAQGVKGKCWRCALRRDLTPFAAFLNPKVSPGDPPRRDAPQRGEGK